MDGLFGLLIVIVIAAVASSNKKKKAARARDAAQRAFDQAHAAKASAKRDPAEAEPQESSAAKLRAARAARLSEQAELEPPRPAQPRVRVRPGSAVVKSGSLHAAEAEGSASVQGTSFNQGSLSTQGEDAAEHAEHRRRIAAEEERLRLETQRLEDMRQVNLDKLRAAVVMSEVLGKPVSLRPRGRR